MTSLLPKLGSNMTYLLKNLVYYILGPKTINILHYLLMYLKASLISFSDLILSFSIMHIRMNLVSFSEVLNREHVASEGAALTGFRDTSSNRPVSLASGKSRLCLIGSCTTKPRIYIHLSFPAKWDCSTVCRRFWTNLETSGPHVTWGSSCRHTSGRGQRPQGKQ